VLLLVYFPFLTLLLLSCLENLAFNKEGNKQLNSRGRERERERCVDLAREGTTREANTMMAVEKVR